MNTKRVLRSLCVIALLVASVTRSAVWADEPPKPIRVLLIGNSQCPTIINNQLLKKLAA